MTEDNKVKSPKTDPIRQHIEGLRIAEFTFRCEARTGISLGPDILKGNRLRGGLGHSLRSVSCAMGVDALCPGCAVKENCFYYMAFEIDRPHPYVIRPIFDGKESYGRGEQFSLGLVLIGDGIPYMYRFIKAFELLGNQGIGRGRGQFFVRDVFPSGTFRASDFFAAGGSRKRHVIRLASPLRLEREGEGVYDTASPFPFSFFVRNLINRTVNLNNLFGDGAGYDRVEINRCIEKLAGRAEGIRCEDDLSWFAGVRHSSRSTKAQKIEGFMGELRLSGDLRSLMPYLKIGEIIGAGSNTTIGFGRFSIG